LRHRTPRLPDELCDDTTRRTRIKGVPDAYYYGLLIVGGLLLEGVEKAMQTLISPAYWGSVRSDARDPNILALARCGARARHHSQGPRAGQRRDREDANLWRIVGKLRASGRMRSAAPRFSPAASGWGAARSFSGSRSRSRSAALRPLCELSRARRISIQSCGRIKSGTPLGWAGGPSFIPIPMEAERAC